VNQVVDEQYQIENVVEKNQIYHNHVMRNRVVDECKQLFLVIKRMFGKLEIDEYVVKHVDDENKKEMFGVKTKRVIALKKKNVPLCNLLIGKLVKKKNVHQR